jgi:mRNA-degrading endonuclease RelE of RelBE toxin-antitoxin system
MGGGKEESGPLETEVQVIVYAQVEEKLQAIKDRHVRKQIATCIEDLKYHPEKGKPLTPIGAIKGCRTARACGQRYRIIYRYRSDIHLIEVFAFGIRKRGDKADVYEQVWSLARSGLLAPLPDADIS